MLTVKNLHKNTMIFKRKKLLRSAYSTFYEDMSKACDTYFKGSGLEIELGSGVGYFKTIRNQIITSDIREGFTYDMSLDATNMALENNSVKCFFAINVFHHLSKPTKFFNELIRVLKKGGGCILIEPHNGLISKFIAKNVHKEEYFDTKEVNWDKKETEIISIGHRNVQGMFYDKKKDLLILVEHGPQGGDEINLNLNPNSKKIKNYGWPIASYGEHYGGRTEKNKNKYIKAPLLKSHEQYGFIEPSKFFVPSIAPSDIIFIPKKFDNKSNNSIYVLNGIRYILSGGLNFKQLFPTSLIFILFFLEKIFSPLS